MAKKCLDETGVVYEVEEIDLREDCDKLQELFKEITGERTVSFPYTIIINLKL
jgi:glutaredoxin